MYKMKPMDVISKTVHVSDPDCWYRRNTVTVSLFVGIPFRDWQEVILIVNSIDDFAMAQRRRFAPNDKTAMECYYRELLECFNSIPDTISVKWLRDRGFEME